ncbi:hypothetical protein ACSBR2_002551 [Camellia fascicularis]
MPPVLHAGAVTGSAHGFSGHPPRGNMTELGGCICRGKAKRTWAQVGTSIKCTSTDTKNLVYLQAIVKETLRLYPPGPLSVPHESIQDCHVFGYYVPKGTHLIVNIWKLHHDPRLWADPDEFRPERFLTSQAKAELRGRSCPGNTLAYQMLHLILARLLQGFNLAILPENGKVDMSEGRGLTLPKATPLEVLVTLRLPSEFYDQP